MMQQHYRSSQCRAALALALFGLTGVLDQAEAAPVSAPITGEIQLLSVADATDPWSRGSMVIGGQNVIIPRNLLIDLPANRLSLQQLFAGAPPDCVAAGESGLARGDSCNASGGGASATVLANLTNGGDVIAGEVLIAKAGETLQGSVTYIDHTDGYLRLNGIPGDPATGAMLRINDPSGRFTIQQGLGCAGGPNCSADPRFGVDADNYTVSFVTGYPACLPSTVVGGNRAQGSDASGLGDPFCPDGNRGANPVADAFRFAPIQLGDHLLAVGNFETVNGVRFLSAHTVRVHLPLSTGPGQPDYLTFEEAAWGVAGFQGQVASLVLLGFTTEPSSQLDVFAVHHDPVSNLGHEVPLASTVGNPATINQGVPPTAGSIFKIDLEVDFQAGVESLLSPCVNLASAGFTPGNGGCPAGVTLDLAQNFAVLSPVSREVIGRTRNKRFGNVGGPFGDSSDIRGNPAPNGEYLTPVALVRPELLLINLGAVQTPFIFAGEPWNLDRHLAPGGCDGPCEASPQPLDPFPYSGLDPRTQAAVPVATRDRILAFYPFGGGDRLAWPPLDPLPQGVLATPQVSLSCQATPTDHAPVFSSVAPVTATVAAAYGYPVQAFDLDPGDSLAFSLDLAPAGMTIDPASGLIAWTPQVDQTGPTAVTVRATDSTGLSATQDFTIEVAPAVDDLAVTRAVFLTAQNRWRILGSSSVVGAGNTVTVHIGPDLGGRVLRTVTVDDAGNWTVVRNAGNPNLLPDGSGTVSVESSAGAVLLGVPVRIR